MQSKTTGDNSITFYNEEYSEHYHSTSGAIEEAFEKFARPCRLKDGMKVLDVCFGLGYNSLAAISLANVEITGLENDKGILEKIETTELPRNYDFDKIKNNTIKNINENNDRINLPNSNPLSIETLKDNYEKIKSASKELNYEDENIKIKIIIGDARETIRKLNDKFDVCFLDPFSIKKCPELWTEGFFRDIRKRMKDNGILTTYSCSKTARKNLEDAGFKPRDGPSVGRKAPSTIAYCTLASCFLPHQGVPLIKENH